MSARTIQLAASHDDRGEEISPATELPYDTLVIAVGSQTNDFGTKGAAQYSIKLDSPAAARHFNDRLINACIRAQSVPPQADGARLAVAIVGGGATGVELAAELHAAARVLSSYGFDHIHPQTDLKIVLDRSRAAPAVAAARTPGRTRQCASCASWRSRCTPARRWSRSRPTASSRPAASVSRSTLTVWAAGIKAPDFLSGLGGADALEVNRLNQLLVNGNLQTHARCAHLRLRRLRCLPAGDGSFVPPRAQAAYQQAMYLVRVLPKLWGSAVPQSPSSPSCSRTRARWCRCRNIRRSAA